MRAWCPMPNTASGGIRGMIQLCYSMVWCNTESADSRRLLTVTVHGLLPRRHETPAYFRRLDSVHAVDATSPGLPFN